MVVYNEEKLKKALKDGEKTIEVQGNYAEKLMQKYNQYIMYKPQKRSWAIAVIGGLREVPLAPLIKPLWVDRLRYYELKCYSKEKLIMEKYENLYV